MARQPVTKYICDRCQKTYQEPPTAASTTSFDKAPPVIHLELNVPAEDGKITPDTVSFNDLCPKCTNRVADLVRQIKLEKTDKEENQDPPPDKQDPQSKSGSKPDKGLDAGQKAPENKSKPTEAKSDAKVNTH